MILLTSVTVAAVLLLVGVLWIALVRICHLLEAIGGFATSTPASLLARIRWGVRAIESQTQSIEPQSRRLAEGMAALAGVLGDLRRQAAEMRGRAAR